MKDLSLVGDIGGTNARFALVREGSLELLHIRTYQCRDYESIMAACTTYLAEVDVDHVSSACLALACPVDAEHINITNNHWQFTRQQLQQCLGIKQLKLVNDFTAMALGMLYVPEQEMLQIEDNESEFDTSGETNSKSQAARLVIGPGTGLGVSGLIKANDDWIPLSTEGGHISFVPVDDKDVAIWQYLRQQYGRVSAERVLCGQGLVNLYQALSHIAQKDNDVLTAAEVTQKAVMGSDDIAVEALHRFCKMLGTVAGDIVLTLGAKGGVYLCGGILPRVEGFFRQSEFRKAFEDKGRFSEYLQKVPVWLCLADNPGLVGAAAALTNPEVSG